MKKLILFLPLLLTGCAGLGQFTGNAAGSFVDVVRRPNVVYVEPRPYYQPNRWRPRPWRDWARRHWHNF